LRLHFSVMGFFGFQLVDLSLKGVDSRVHRVHHRMMVSTMMRRRGCGRGGLRQRRTREQHKGGSAQQNRLHFHFYSPLGMFKAAQERLPQFPWNCALGIREACRLGERYATSA
jgi:hypothetical protein